jgi:hypothetical protein
MKLSHPFSLLCGQARSAWAWDGCSLCDTARTHPRRHTAGHVCWCLLVVRVEVQESRILPVPTMFSGWSTTTRHKPGGVDSVLCWCVSEVSPPNWPGLSLSPAARRNERAAKSWGRPSRLDPHFRHFAQLSRLDSIESGPVLVGCVHPSTGAIHSRRD